MEVDGEGVGAVVNMEDDGAKFGDSLHGSDAGLDEKLVSMTKTRAY